MSDWTEHEMVGICCLSECGNNPHEWPYIAQVIYNRVRSPKFPDTVCKVILQPYQFSAFNDDEGFDDVVAGWGPGTIQAAVACAQWVSYSNIQQLPILPPTVLHFWSPQSMQPRWSAPSWASGMKWIVPPGIDSRRFIFGEG